MALLRLHDHTDTPHSLELVWASDQSNLTIHNSHKRETSMSPARFEPAAPASKLPQTYVLDRAAIGMDRGIPE